MSFILKSISYFIASRDENLLQNQEDTFNYSYEWEIAVQRLFKDVLFVHEKEIIINGKKNFVTLIFNPHRKRTYIIARERFQYFIDKYYPTKRIVERQPSFYSFLIPFPNIEYQEENSKISWEDRFNISLSKFYLKTFQPLERYIVRLKTPNTFDFRENLFDPIFQINFEDIIDLSEKYKNYLSLFLNIDCNQIDIRNLIVPFYQLSSDEINA